MSVSLRIKVYSVIAYVALSAVIAVGWHPAVTVLAAGAFG